MVRLRVTSVIDTCGLAGCVGHRHRGRGGVGRVIGTIGPPLAPNLNAAVNAAAIYERAMEMLGEALTMMRQVPRHPQKITLAAVSRSFFYKATLGQEPTNERRPAASGQRLPKAMTTHIANGPRPRHLRTGKTAYAEHKMGLMAKRPVKSENISATGQNDTKRYGAQLA